MIIWINGAFGSGKTTTAKLLKSKIKNSHIYDPEEVGYFLWDNFPDNMKEKGDFQDIRIWRSINYQVIKYIYDNYNGVLIVPMTIANVEYFNEIIGNLIKDNIDMYHIILNADKEVIKQRLINRGECENSWAEQQIDRCLDAFENNIKGLKINTNDLSVEEVVEVIIKNSDLNL